MLHEVGANLAVMESLAQAADSKIQVGKYRSIAFLNDQLIEKTKASREGIEISFDSASSRKQSRLDKAAAMPSR